MKVVALSFLVGATGVFLGCRWAQSAGITATWVGYVGAAAEAGMVGALADWFAVTALFKHPLGIPIPHTAIIKRKKDQLGEGLGTFVRENFLSPPVVETKLRDAQIPSRLGKWLSETSHAQRVAAESATVLRVMVELLRDDDVQHVIDRMIVRRLAEPQWGPPVGRVLATLLAENRQEALIQLLADRAFQWSLNAGEVIQRVVERDSPSWSPRFIDHLVGDRIHRELMDFTDKVRRNPDHELRRSATRFLFEFADDLQHDERDHRAGRGGQRAVDGPRGGHQRRGDGVEDAEAPGARGCRRPVQRTAHPHRRRGGAASANHCATTPICGTRSTTGSCGAPSIWSPSMGSRSQRLLPTPSSAGTPRKPVGASNCTSAVTCSSSGSTAPWWARWPGWSSTRSRSCCSEHC